MYLMWLDYRFYLKLRCAQLQGDVTDLSGELLRARQELERIHGVRAARKADPLSEGR